MMRKFMFVGLLIVILVLTACGGQNSMDSDTSQANNTETTQEEQETQPFKFGMILVGPRSDRGWSQAHFEGGEYVEENLDGAEMIVFEKLNPADSPEATVESVVDEMVAQLQGLEIVNLVVEQPADPWCDFTFRGHRFLVRNGGPNYHFFVGDPQCSM